MILEVSWDGLWTLSFGLSQFHGHGSWLMCEVALKPFPTPKMLKWQAMWCGGDWTMGMSNQFYKKKQYYWRAFALDEWNKIDFKVRESGNPNGTESSLSLSLQKFQPKIQTSSHVKATLNDDLPPARVTLHMLTLGDAWQKDSTSLRYLQLRYCTEWVHPHMMRALHTISSIKIGYLSSLLSAKF